MLPRNVDASHRDRISHLAAFRVTGSGSTSLRAGSVQPDRRGHVEKLWFGACRADSPARTPQTGPVCPKSRSPTSSIGWSVACLGRMVSACPGAGRNCAAHTICTGSEFAPATCCIECRRDHCPAYQQAAAIRHISRSRGSHSSRATASWRTTPPSRRRPGDLEGRGAMRFCRMSVAHPKCGAGERYARADRMRMDAEGRNNRSWRRASLRRRGGRALAHS